MKFSKITGEIFVNPRYTGNITNVRKIFDYTPSTANLGSELEVIDNAWESIVVLSSEPDIKGLVVSGEKGTLKIDLSGGGSPIEVDGLQPLSDLVISLGQLSATLLVPARTNITQPSGFEIGILDHKANKFVTGDIVAMNNNQVAIRFEGLPSTVVADDGMVRISLKESGDKFLNGDIKAWGYNVFVSDTDIEKPSPIKAEVFGLPMEAKLQFAFQSLPGQEITPSTKTLTVKEINSGEPIVTIVTSIPGAQPLSVSVERIK
ncbi:MAG: hypothetical protein ACRENZ_10610 [Thermodesulfobacteriota bacterium]